MSKTVHGYIMSLPMLLLSS